MKPVELPAVREILDKAVDMYGGRDAVAAIKTLRMVCSADVNGQTFRIESLWSRTRGTKEIWQTPSGGWSTSSNGVTHWTQNQNGFALQDMPQDTQAQLLVSVLQPYDWLNNAMGTVSVIGYSVFADRLCYEIRELDNPITENISHYYDKETSLYRGSQLRGPGGTQQNVVFGNWQSTDGVLMFRSMQLQDTLNPDSVVVMNISSIEINTLDDAAFKMPEEVAKLRDEKRSNEIEVISNNNLPSADDVYTRAMEAMGGTSKIRRIESISLTATTKSMNGDVVREHKWARFGGRHTKGTTKQDMREFGTDGKSPWAKIGDQYVLLDPVQPSALLTQSEMYIDMIDPAVSIASENASGVVDALVRFEGRPCYRVVAMYQSSFSQDLFFDQETHLLVGAQQVARRKRETQVFKDWKEVDGILMFHTIELHDPTSPLGTMVTHLSDVHFNSLTKDDFALPDEVKAASAEPAEPDTTSETSESESK